MIEPNHAATSADRADRERVRWRSRRGMLELDLLLVDFADKRYPSLSPTLRRDYRAVLECDDWVVLDWLRGRESPPPGLRAVVKAIQAFNRLG